jgi:hypothetical protein
MSARSPVVIRPLRFQEIFAIIRTPKGRKLLLDLELSPAIFHIRFHVHCLAREIRSLTWRLAIARIRRAVVMFSNVRTLKFVWALGRGLSAQSCSVPRELDSSA